MMADTDLEMQETAPLKTIGANQDEGADASDENNIATATIYNPDTGQSTVAEKEVDSYFERLVRATTKYPFTTKRITVLSTFLAVNVVLILYDIISDLRTGIDLLQQGHFHWGIWTIALQFMPFVGHCLDSCFWIVRQKLKYFNRRYAAKPSHMHIDPTEMFASGVMDLIAQGMEDVVRQRPKFNVQEALNHLPFAQPIK